MTTQHNRYCYIGAVEERDFEILEKGFPGINYRALTEEIERLSCYTPTLSALVLVGGVFSLACTTGTGTPTAIGFFPFKGFNPEDSQPVILPTMDGIVEHFESSALASEMWLSANLYLRRNNNFEVRFMPNSGCAAVPNKAFHDGSWRLFQKEYNELRRNITGRNDTARRKTDSITNTSITDTQLAMWRRVRTVLHSASPRTTTPYSKNLVA